MRTGQLCDQIDEGNFVCIGMDTSLATFFLGTIFDGFMGIQEAMRLGIWITALSKIHASGVSGPTMAFSYKKGTQEWERHFTPEIAEIEEMVPVAYMKQLLHRYWIDKNPDIYEIIDNVPIRSVKY